MGVPLAIPKCHQTEEQSYLVDEETEAEGTLERTIEDCGGSWVLLAWPAGNERVASCLVYNRGACQEQGRPWAPRVCESETARGMSQSASRWLEDGSASDWVPNFWTPVSSFFFTYSVDEQLAESVWCRTTTARAVMLANHGSSAQHNVQTGHWSMFECCDCSHQYCDVVL
jgi:hypothetical protein